MSTNEFSHDVATVHTNPNRIFGSLSRSVMTLLDFLTQREAVRVLFNRPFQVKNGTCETSLDYQALIHLLFVGTRRAYPAGIGTFATVVSGLLSNLRQNSSFEIAGRTLAQNHLALLSHSTSRIGMGKSAVPRFVSPRRHPQLAHFGTSCSP